MIPIRVEGSTGTAKVYALIDGGSTITVIDKKFAHSLGLRGESVDMTVRGLWNGEKHATCERLSFVVHGEFGERKIEHALAVPHVDLPAQTLSSGITRQVKRKIDIELEPYTNAKPLILIGQDNWRLFDVLESRPVGDSGLVASRMSLGWALHGYLLYSQNESRTLNLRATCCATSCAHFDERERFDELNDLCREYFVLENLGVAAPSARNNQADRATKILHETTRKIGRQWETGLLWKSDTFPDMRDTRATALKRMYSMEKRLDRDEKLAEKFYSEVNRWIENGYAVKVDKNASPSPRRRYLSIFCVRNPNKPNKVRPVHDAAEKTNGRSFNDMIDTGPDLLESLPGVLTRFRQYPFAVKADITDMYLRIRIAEKDQAAQTFLYRGADRSREPDEWEMRCLIFGSKSSPSSALFVKNKNAKCFERVKPEAARSIEKNSYMDDYLVSGDDPSKMRQLVRDVILINREANFEMHGWASNDASIVEQVRTVDKGSNEKKANLCNDDERVLGLYWDMESDSLRFNVGLHKIDENVVSRKSTPTKRELFSTAMSVYDPLGILSPFTLNAKLLMQDIWISGVGWDSKIREDEVADWVVWLKNLKQMADCKIPRSFISVGADYESAQLHVFCDASKEAFAAVAYLRTTAGDHSIHLALAMAKSRVAPVKPTTIPRLELQAALLGARLAATVIKELDVKINQRIFWSDSTTVLHWINTGPRSKQVFVSNRLGEINATTSSSEWRWVPTSLNPADDSTRRSSKPMRSDDRWFTGPPFLRDQAALWPKSKVLSDLEKQEANKLEARKEFIGAQFIDDSGSWEVGAVLRVLGWNKILQTVARVRKIFNIWYLKTKAKRNKPNLSRQAVDEKTETRLQRIREAEHFWYRLIQNAYFPNELEALLEGKDIPRGSKLIGLRPFIDNEGLLRARGRVTRVWNEEKQRSVMETTEFENQPIILNANHYATKLLIDDYHRRYFHANNETIVNELRQQFYIVGLRTRLRWLSKRCITCRLRRAKPLNPPMGDLPKCRVAIGQRPFSQCGLDYFGPMFVKIGRRREKRWGVLFTCMTTRAVHLELADTLSASSTIMAVQRLAAMRGLPSAIYSDNGTNFVKASKELRDAIVDLDTEKQLQFAEAKRLTWRFNPPDAAHMGGAWERLVRSVKTAIDHALNGESVSEEVLKTLLAEISHMVNSRPLTHVSVDPNDEEALTPNHFLLGSSSGNLSLPRYEEQILNPRRTFEIAQNRAKGFWRRWIREYLPTLLPRKKWHQSIPPLKVGDIVLICDYQTPRNFWRKGRITEVRVNQSDGISRSAIVRTGKTFLTRPVHKLIKIFGTEDVKN